LKAFCLHCNYIYKEVQGSLYRVSKHLPEQENWKLLCNLFFYNVFMLNVLLIHFFVQKSISSCKNSFRFWKKWANISEIEGNIFELLIKCFVNISEKDGYFMPNGMKNQQTAEAFCKIRQICTIHYRCPKNCSLTHLRGLYNLFTNSLEIPVY